MNYFVGGAAKMYGAALFRLRQQDFQAQRTADGMTPDWPLGYDDFEPWYTGAEQLYQVHGQRGVDPPTRRPVRRIPTLRCHTSRVCRRSPTA